MRHHAASEIAQRHLLECTLHRLIDPEHESTGGTGDADRADRLTLFVPRFALDQIPRSLEHFDELTKGDLFCIALERVTAADSAMRTDDAAVLERLQHFGDHRKRQVIEGCHFACGDHFALLPGQVDRCKQSVVSESGYFQHEFFGVGRQTVPDRYGLFKQGLGPACSLGASFSPCSASHSNPFSYGFHPIRTGKLVMAHGMR